MKEKTLEEKRAELMRKLLEGSGNISQKSMKGENEDGQIQIPISIFV